MLCAPAGEMRIGNTILNVSKRAHPKLRRSVETWIRRGTRVPIATAIPSASPVLLAGERHAYYPRAQVLTCRFEIPRAVGRVENYIRILCVPRFFRIGL